MMQYLIGIDVGTTHIKAILFDENGNPIISSVKNTPVSYHDQDHAVMDPDELWEMISGMLKELSQSFSNEVGSVELIRAIAVTGMGEAGILLGRQGEALSSIIAWFDKRTIPSVQQLERILSSSQM